MNHSTSKVRARRASQWLAAATLLAALIAGCSRKDVGNSAPGDTPSTNASTGPSTAPSSSPATTEAADVEPPEPIEEMTDPATQPGVWLSVNGQASPSVPQGTAIIIRATVRGARGKPFEFKPADVRLTIADAAGKPVNWPVRQAAATQPASRPAISPGGSVTWVVPDSHSIPPGEYHISAKLNGAVPHDTVVTLVPTETTPTAEQQTTRFVTNARAALALGEPQRALDAADQRLKSAPHDVPALHVKADALAALGRTKDAASAYTQAIDEFAAQNPKVHEPPLELIQSYQALGDQK